jgi:isochorismate synthase
MERITNLGKETRNSDFAKSENKQDQEYFESLVQGIDSIHEGLSKKLLYLEKKSLRQIVLI